MKAVPRKGWKSSGSLWLIIAKELFDSSGDINHNYTGDVSEDPKRGPQNFTDTKWCFCSSVDFRIEFETVKTSHLHWKWMKTEEKSDMYIVAEACSRFRVLQLRPDHESTSNKGLSQHLSELRWNKDAVGVKGSSTAVEPRNCKKKWMFDRVTEALTVGNGEIKGKTKMKQAAVVFFFFYALKKWFLFQDLNVYCGSLHILAVEPEWHRQTDASQQESQR